MPEQKTQNILITGRPGVGKTTLLVALSRELSTARPTGFFTREIRERGKRRGFELVSLDGERMTLAHTDFAHGPRVGKYTVDLPGFEAFLDRLAPPEDGAGLVLIDEIGKMECLSPKFNHYAERALDSPAPLLASVASKGGGFIDAVKKRDDVRLTDVTEDNREDLVHELKQSLALLLP
jgi:nucleoside-triphosphatase